MTMTEQELEEYIEKLIDELMFEKWEEER